MFLKLFKIIIVFINSVIFRILENKKYTENYIECVIFSKDRPIQLNALLESFYKNCTDDIRFIVLFKYSDEKFRTAYNELSQIYFEKKIILVEENNFRVDLLNILSNINSKYLFFLVDDIIFKSQFTFNNYLSLNNRDKYILSLRLGNNLNFSFTKSKPQKLPNFEIVDDFFSWNFRKSELDWAYTFSVDGNLYITNQIKLMSSLVDFNGPNSYESNMNFYRILFYLKRGLCFKKSKLVNVSLNRVQDEILNLSGNYNIDELCKIWSNNLKIDVTKFSDIENESAHIEVENLLLVNRE
jgi:hypothetical protein